jgi:peroxiredoxin
LDLEGISRQPLDPRAKAASVLFFYWHDCPVSNGYAPAMNRLCASYTNFAFYIVQVDPDLNVAAAKEHARQYGLRPPVLLDPQHRLVKQVGATVTPQAIVVAKDGQVLYRGRIDNRYSAVGKKSEVATQHDLRDALDAIAAGRPPKQKETKAFGCVIQSK